MTIAAPAINYNKADLYYTYTQALLYVSVKNIKYIKSSCHVLWQSITRQEDYK